MLDEVAAGGREVEGVRLVKRKAKDEDSIRRMLKIMQKRKR